MEVDFCFFQEGTVLLIPLIAPCKWALSPFAFPLFPCLPLYFGGNKGSSHLYFLSFFPPLVQGANMCRRNLAELLSRCNQILAIVGCHLSFFASFNIYTLTVKLTVIENRKLKVCKAAVS